MMEPRKPTSEEKQELADWMSKNHCETADITITFEASAIAVFDDYLTICPGYWGKIMMVVHAHMPSLFDVFTWENGQITRQIPHQLICGHEYLWQ